MKKKTAKWCLGSIMFCGKRCDEKDRRLLLQFRGRCNIQERVMWQKCRGRAAVVSRSRLNHAKVIAQIDHAIHPSPIYAAYYISAWTYPILVKTFGVTCSNEKII